MAVLTKDEYRNRINARVGESFADEDLSFLEDMTDTYDALAGSEEEIRRLTEENESLRRRYRERFEVGDPLEKEDKPADMIRPDPDPEETKIKSVEELFFNS